MNDELPAIPNRLQTFRFRDALPFTQIVASERSLSGKALIYGGFTSRLLSTLSIQATVYVAYVLRPLERILLATRASSRTRRFFRRWQDLPTLCLRLFLECLFYPFAYHSYLQRLGLVSAKPLLPPLRAFIPFSKWSPLLPFSLHYGASCSALDLFKAAMTSPFVFVCMEHFYERWVYAAVYEVIERSVVHPDNPDMLGREDGSKSRTTSILGLRRRSPSLIRGAVNKLLVTIGWGEPFSRLGETEREQATSAPRRPEIRGEHAIEVGGNQVTNLNRLELPLARQNTPPATEALEPESLLVPINTSTQSTPGPPTPQSPTASQTSEHDNDPRIRITSREGIVEMEVRLPPHVLSSHTEIAGSGPSTPDQRDATLPNPVRTPDTRMYHRVTTLSSEPAQMIGAICKAQIVTWMTLPLKLVTLRLVASHYLARRQGYIGPRRVLDPLPAMSDSNWPSIGVQMSRIALCGAFELAIDLTLWGCQYVVVTWMGTKSFGWGAL